MTIVAISADPDDSKPGLYKLFSLSSVPGERPREVSFPEIKRERPLGSDAATMVCNRTWYGNSAKFNF